MQLPRSLACVTANADCHLGWMKSSLKTYIAGSVHCVTMVIMYCTVWHVLCERTPQHLDRCCVCYRYCIIVCSTAHVIRARGVFDGCSCTYNSSEHLTLRFRGCGCYCCFLRRADACVCAFESPLDQCTWWIPDDVVLRVFTFAGNGRRYRCSIDCRAGSDDCREGKNMNCSCGRLCAMFCVSCAHSVPPSVHSPLVNQVSQPVSGAFR